MDFGKEAEEHKGIHDALDTFSAHVKAALADPSKFDAARLTQILSDLRAPLLPLLHTRTVQAQVKYYSVCEMESQSSLS